MTLTLEQRTCTQPDLRPEQIADPVVGHYTPEEWAIVRGLLLGAFRALPDHVMDELAREDG